MPTRTSKLWIARRRMDDMMTKHSETLVHQLTALHYAPLYNLLRDHIVASFPWINPKALENHDWILGQRSPSYSYCSSVMVTLVPELNVYGPLYDPSTIERVASFLGVEPPQPSESSIAELVTKARQQLGSLLSNPTHRRGIICQYRHLFSLLASDKTLELLRIYPTSEGVVTPKMVARYSILIAVLTQFKASGAREEG